MLLFAIEINPCLFSRVSLSLELIFAICDEVCYPSSPAYHLLYWPQLDLDDRKHLRLTCKPFAEGLASLVMRDIHILETEDSTTNSEIISRLQFLSQTNNAASQYARSVTIDSAWSLGQNMLNDEELLELKDAFLRAILSLRAVDTVMYVPNIWETKLHSFHLCM